MNLSNQIKEILFNSISLLIIFFTTLIAIFIWLLSTKFFGGSDLIIFQQSFFYSLSIIGPLIILLIINKKTSVYLIFIISLLLSISYIITSFPLIHRHFKDKQEIPIEKIGQSIAKCTNYNDIVFSFELEIPDRPTVLISQSMKRVYLISSLKDIEQKIKNITKPFQIKLFYLSKPNKKIYKFLNNLGQYKCSGFYYTSFSKEQLNNQLLQNRGN
jgi:hypothetical protein